MSEASKPTYSPDRPLWIWLAICSAIAFAYNTAVIAALGDWPWIAAAFGAPLWATIGAGYVSLLDRRRERGL